MMLSESTKRNLCLLPGVLALAYVLGMQACRSPRESGTVDEGEPQTRATVPTQGSNAVERLVVPVAAAP